LGRKLLWLLVPALPLAVILGVLALQDAPAPARATTPVETLPPTRTPTASQEWSFALLHADGSPASDGVVIVLEPAIARAEISPDGTCRLALRKLSPVRVLAWAPGHQVREAGPWESPPLELRLDAMEDLPAAELPLQLASLGVQLTNPDGTALAGALLLARPVDHPEAPPWMAFSDQSGVAACEVEDAPLLLQVYSPGRAPRAPWLLASDTRPASDAEMVWVIATASLQISGLPPMEPVQLRRDGEALDLLAVSEDGFARWDALAPGAWEIGTAAGRMRLILEPGERRTAWIPDPGP